MQSKVANSLMNDTNLDAIASVLDEAMAWNQVHRSIRVEDLIRRLCKKYYILATGKRSNY